MSAISDEKTKERLQAEFEKLRKEIDQNKGVALGNSKERPDISHAYKQLADLLTKQRRFDEAEMYLREAIEMQKAK